MTSTAISYSDTRNISLEAIRELYVVEWLVSGQKTDCASQRLTELTFAMDWLGWRSLDRIRQRDL